MASILKLLFVVLAPFKFPGPGGGAFGESLQSVAAVLMDTCQQDRRGSALHRFFCASADEFSRSGEAWVSGFRWIATPGGGSFMYMHANVTEGQA